MSEETKLEPKAIEKIHLYIAAMYLYSVGKSHPQVVKALSEYSYDNALIVKIADKAMKDEWDRLYENARILFAEEKPYNEVLATIRAAEEDADVADFIVNRWYDYKTMQMELLVESPTNTAEGLKWVIISGLVIPVLFLAGASVVSKILWVIVFIGAFIQWLLGMEQRKLSKKFKIIFESELIDKSNE